MSDDLGYLEFSYVRWLESARDYYFLDDNSDDPTMSDEEWTSLARAYVNNIQYFNFLQEINFNGTSLGVGCSKGDIEGAIRNAKIGLF